METIKTGIIHNRFMHPRDCPKQGRFSEEISTIEVYPEFSGALLGLEANQYYLVLYEAHLADRKLLQTVPPWSDRLYGVFASRSPHRPNPISICVVQVLKIEGNCLQVKGLDAINGSALLDIKPYIRELEVGETKGHPFCKHML